MRKLYVLPFDHRGSFAKMFGMSHGELSGEQFATLRDYKHVIYEGFLAALKLGVCKDDAAILIDEEFGAKIHEEAGSIGITRILTTEKSGQDEFDFEYSDGFSEHINKIRPDYVKVLVRYNPADKELNARQLARLKTMNDFCTEANYRFLFELLAVPTDAELAEVGGKEEYEKMMQWKTMKQSVAEVKAAGIYPDVWKLEGLESREQFAAVVEEAVRPSGRGVNNNYSPSEVEGVSSGRPSTSLGDNNKEVGVIVLGRDEGGEKVRKWLSAAVGIPGVVGLAVGRTVFKQSLMDFAAGKITREEAAEQIAKNYKGFVEVFENKS